MKTACIIIAEGPFSHPLLDELTKKLDKIQMIYHISADYIPYTMSRVLLSDVVIAVYPWYNPTATTGTLYATILNKPLFILTDDVNLLDKHTPTISHFLSTDTLVEAVNQFFKNKE